jgi:hypothetical protein
MTPRLASLRSSFADLLGLGGTIFRAMLPTGHEVSWEEFKTVSEDTTSQLEFLTAS